MITRPYEQVDPEGEHVLVSLVDPHSGTATVPTPNLEAEPTAEGSGANLATEPAATVLAVKI